MSTTCSSSGSACFLKLPEWARPCVGGGVRFVRFKEWPEQATATHEEKERLERDNEARRQKQPVDFRHPTAILGR